MKDSLEGSVGSQGILIDPRVINGEAEYRAGTTPRKVD